MQNLIRIINQGHHSLVVEKDDAILCYDGRGISDLIYLLDNKVDFLRDARVADKVVGKAAAGLMLVAGVREIYAELISTPAIQLIKSSEVKLSFLDEVNHIINFSGTDWCPLERLCYSLTTPEEIYSAIKDFICKRKGIRFT